MNISSALNSFRPRDFNRNLQSFFLYGILING